MSRDALEAARTEYARNFANRPRVTRDGALLEGLVARIRPIAAGGGELGLDAKSSVDAWTREAALIAELQAGGDLARSQHARNSLMNMANRRYIRHYAGQSRNTREVELLAELAEASHRWSKESSDYARSWDHSTFAETRARLSENTELYRRELEAVRAAVRSGSTDDRATALATRANHQFRWYRQCFAGKDRASRRIALLERAVRELQSISSDMSELVRMGYETTVHRKNLDLVNSRIEAYREEIRAIHRARSDVAYGKVFEAVAKSANDIFAAYREGYAGQSRTTRDPEALGALCDELYEVAQNMDDLDRERGDSRNQANLLIVLEELSMYESEIDRIREARGIPARQ